LGLALRRLPDPPRVAAWARRPETRAEALRLGAADEVHDTPAAACAHADAVVVCTPVPAMAGVLATCVGSLTPRALVTDVGSVKARVVQEAERTLAGSGAWFVGSHPIAGAEQQGIASARPDLYRGAVVVVTPSPATRPEALARVKEFWTRLGARVRLANPEEHDRLLARTSHLPHMAAAALACAVGRDSRPEALADFCGTGFRDATRLAAGGPDLWCDIVKSNQAATLEELKAFRREIDRLLTLVETADFEGVRIFLEQGRDRRARMLANGEGTP
jgi:prephenate dehydrogenase